MEDDHESALTLRRMLEPGETIKVEARAIEAVLAVTDRRLVVAAADRTALAIPVAAVRRIQFDIERNRPATLVAQIIPLKAYAPPPLDDAGAAAAANGQERDGQRV